jgi:hypothetical protein
MHPMASPAPHGYCVIFSIAHKHACRWKWRQFADDGSVMEGNDDYEGYLDCVAAARALGLAPRAFWIGPLSLCMSRK